MAEALERQRERTSSLQIPSEGERLPSEDVCRSEAPPNWPITGHGSFPAYYERLDLAETDNCQYCNWSRPVDEIHLFTLCPRVKDRLAKPCPRPVGCLEALQGYLTSEEGDLLGEPFA